MYVWLFIHIYIYVCASCIYGCNWIAMVSFGNEKKKPQSKIVYTFMKHAQKEKIFLKPQLGITESQIKGRLYEIE